MKCRGGGLEQWPGDCEVSTDAEPDERCAPDRPRRVLLFALAAVLLFALDVVSKVLVVAKLPQDHTPVRILGGIVYLDQIRNSGAAFSLGTGFTIILTVIALVVVAVLVRTANRLRSVGWALAFGLILGGAIGNLVDRFFRAPGVGRGHVVDWISLFGRNGEHWPVFNIADSGIVIGAIVAGVLALLGIEFDGRPRNSAKHARSEP